MPNINQAELEILIAKIANDDKSLANLNLANQEITDAQMSQIADALKNNRTVKTLNLENNRIKLAGAQAIATMLQSNSTLEEIDLSRNRVETAGARAIKAGIENNISIKKIRLLRSGVGGGANDYDLSKIFERNICFHHNIYVKLFYQHQQNHEKAENLSKFELKFLSNVNHPENCVKIFEYFCRRFSPNQDPANLLNGLKNEFGVGLRFLVTSALATTNSRNLLPRKIASTLNQVNLLDFLKVQGVVKNPAQMLQTKEAKIAEGSKLVSYKIETSHNMLKIGEVNLRSILEFLTFDDFKYKPKVVVENDNMSVDNENSNSDSQSSSPSISSNNSTAQNLITQISSSKIIG